MTPVNPLKRRAAAVMQGIGVTALSAALQRVALAPFIRVLYYHDVPPALADHFARQLEFFRRHFVAASRADLELLLAGGRWPHDRPGIILTFDDGLRSHAEVVAPLLEQAGFQGWFFAPVDLAVLPPAEQPAAATRHSVLHDCDTTADPRIFMTEAQLRDLSVNHVVGCHTGTHVRLSDQLTPEVLQAELVTAKERLEGILGRPVDSFSWVGGEEWAYSAAAADLVARHFQYSFTTNTCVTRSSASRLNIDRTHVEAWFSPALVRLQLCGLMDLYYRAKRRRVAISLSAANRAAALQPYSSADAS